MVWKGVIIEESLEDKRLLDSVNVVVTKKSSLEEEKEKGFMKFHNIEVEDRKKDKFVQQACKSIKQGWYIHICSGDRMVVIFKGKSFELEEKEHSKLDEARKYGLPIGIIKEQLPSKDLIKNPYD